MNPELQKEIFDRLDALAAKMGVAVEWLWPIFVRQQYVMVGPGIVLTLLAAAAGVGMAKWSKRLKQTQGCTCDDPWVGAAIASGVFWVATIVGLCALAFAGVPRLINPEYYALVDLVEVVK